MENLQEQLQSVFREVFDRDDLVIARAMTAAEIEGWDSLTHIHLVVAIEKSFKMKFTTAEIIALKNIGDMMNLIETKRAA